MESGIIDNLFKHPRIIDIKQDDDDAFFRPISSRIKMTTLNLKLVYIRDTHIYRNFEIILRKKDSGSFSVFE